MNSNSLASPVLGSTPRKIVGAASRVIASPIEHFALSTLFVLLLIAYGSIGRDIFFNRLNDPNIEDPIGAILVYVRFGLCALTVFVVYASGGLGVIREAVPPSLLPFVFLALVSCAWAEEIKNVLRAALVLASLTIAMPLILHRLGRVKTTALLLHTIAFVVIVSALLALLVPSIGTHSGQEVVQSSHVGRWRGVFMHKNGLGPWGAFGTIVLVVYERLMPGPRVYKFVAWLSAVGCLFMSGSATSIIGCLTMAITLVLLRINRAAGSGVALVAIVLGQLVAILLVAAFSDKVFGLLGRDETFTGRTEIWGVALDYISQAPLLGNGYQSLGGPIFLDFVSNLAQQTIPGPENLYLAGLLDLGLVGVVLFFWPIFAGIVRAMAHLPSISSRDERAALEMMVLIVVAALFMGITETTPFLCTGFDGAVCLVGVYMLVQFRPGLRDGRRSSNQIRPLV